MNTLTSLLSNTPFMVSMLLLVLGIMILNTYIISRNDMVFKYRSGLLDRIHKTNMDDIFCSLRLFKSMPATQALEKTKNVRDERYKMFESVSYNKMLYSFRPLESFYPPEEEWLKPMSEEE